MFVGAMDIVEAIAGDPESRALAAITGVLALLAGLVCLRRPGESLLALVIVLGFYLIVTGVIRFVRSFASLEDRALLMGLSILDIIIGILILSLPKLSLVTLAVLFAISLLARGVFSRGHRLQAARRAPQRRAGRRRDRLMQRARRTGMAWVPAGEFAMGSEDFYPEEGPVRPVAVEGFWIDRDPVTVAEFRRFVKATGHVTVAERPLDPDDYPDADPELLVPGALVFRPSRGPVDLRDFHNWWDYVPGHDLAAAGGPGERHLHARAPPGDAGRVRGRERLCGVGRQGAPDRGRVGVRRPRRARRRGVRLGRRVRAGWPDDGQHLAGRVPVAEPARRRLRGHLTGRLVRAQRLRPARHDRQRLGVDLRPARRRSHRAEPLLWPQRGGRAHPAARDQGRLAPVRAELLPALPPGRPPVRGGRHLDGPHRLPLRRAR